jgi:hypothetical protein
VKYYVWSIALYDAEIWTLQKPDPKYLESFKMWCWRKMEKIIWTDRVRNEADWIHHILLRNSLLKHIIEGKTEGCIEVTGRQGSSDYSTC